MRNLALALLTGLAIVASAPAHAVGTRYPFCMQGNDVPGLSDCSYTGYAQCQATASGRFLNCIQIRISTPATSARVAAASRAVHLSGLLIARRGPDSRRRRVQRANVN